MRTLGACVLAAVAIAGVVSGHINVNGMASLVWDIFMGANKGVQEHVQENRPKLPMPTRSEGE